MFFTIVVIIMVYHTQAIEAMIFTPTYCREWVCIHIENKKLLYL